MSCGSGSVRNRVRIYEQRFATLRSLRDGLCCGGTLYRRAMRVPCWSDIVWRRLRRSAKRPAELRRMRAPVSLLRERDVSLWRPGSGVLWGRFVRFGPSMCGWAVSAVARSGATMPTHGCITTPRAPRDRARSHRKAPRAPSLRRSPRGHGAIRPRRGDRPPASGLSDRQATHAAQRERSTHPSWSYGRACACGVRAPHKPSPERP